MLLAFLLGCDVAGPAPKAADSGAAACTVPLWPDRDGDGYKDKDDEAKAWLARFGDPYLLSAVDTQGRIGIDYGVYGVPETYVIDKQGVIRYKRIGAVTPKVLEENILPLVKKLQG